MAQLAFRETANQDDNEGIFYTNYLQQIFSIQDFQCSSKDGTDANTVLENTVLTESDMEIQNCLYQNSYTAQCEVCNTGYALDEHKIVCSRIIDHCEEYDTSFACAKCEKDYIKSISLNGHHH